MKVLYVGATGNVGSYVAPILKDKYDLTLTGLGGGEVDGLPVVDLDIADWEAVEKLVLAGAADGSPFDAIVNCAIADPRNRDMKDLEERRKYYELCIEVNARGAYHLYEAAARAKIPRVVYVGSLTAVLGHPRYPVLDEESVDRPANVYAACKIFGEHAGRAYAYNELNGATGMQVICLRLGQPYPSDFFSMRDHHWLKTSAGRALAVDVRDIAQAIDCALEIDVHYGVYSIVSGSDEPYVSPVLYQELGYKPRWKFTREGLLPAEDCDVFEPQILADVETASNRS